MKNVGWIYKPEAEFGRELNRAKHEKRVAKEVVELRKLVREYFKCIEDTPNVNFILEHDLRNKLKKAANWKEK
jgi:hypothetical protein